MLKKEIKEKESDISIISIKNVTNMEFFILLSKKKM